MRIAFVAQPFDVMTPPVQGGSLAIWIYQIARVCARRGAGVVAFGNHGGLLRAGRASEDGMNYVFTPTGVNRFLNRLSVRWGSNGELPRFASHWQDLGYAREVGWRARREACDVVHVMNYSQFVPVIRRRHPRGKIVLHMQCEWLTQLDRAVIARRLVQVDLMVGCSPYITRKVAEAFPEFGDRCVTVPNAAPVPTRVEADRQEAGREVLFVGRVSPEKGVHDLIVAFHDVLKRFPEARLRIVGGAGSAPLEYLVGLSSEPHVMALRKFYEGNGVQGKDPYLVHLERYAGVELGKRITFEGRVDYNQTQQFYQRAAVLVNPSLSESFGMSLVEAMMHGVPVVATNVGGMPYIVEHERTGYVVEPAAPRSLAAAICRLLENRDLARGMGVAGRQRAVEQFSWESSADLLLQHYRSLLQ
jgi:glycosyltransferase involved in cell wall biosynthesis